MSRSLLGLGLVALVALSCADEPPPASANLRRPSGMAYAERVRVSSTPSRDDLFVADSESEGVRVRQFESNGNTVADTFIPSFAVYIPLSIAAPGFPEELALSTEPSHARLYTLAPAGTLLEMPAGGGTPVERVGLLHVLDVREVPFGARATADGNVPIGTIALDQLTTIPTVPTDVEVLGALSDSEDLVAVVLDSFDGSDAQLAVFTVRHTPVPAVITGTAETTVIARGVRTLFKLDDRLFASSAATSSVTEIGYSVARSGAIAGVRRLNAGGPTGQIFGGPGGTVLALRLDRSAVAVFEPSPAGFVRSTRFFDSPYTPVAEREATAPADRTGEPAIGRIDLRASPAAVGALGRVTVLADSSKNSGIRGSDFDGGSAPVALIGHLDGLATFVTGNPPRLALTHTASVSSLRQLSGDAQILECGATPVACVTSDTGAPGCDDIVVFDRPAVSTFRAVYRGALAKSRSGALEVVASSSSALDISLVDAAVGSFADRLIVAGDRLLVQVRAPKVCPTGDISEPEVELIDEGTITRVEGDVIAARFVGPLAGFVPCGGVVTVFYEAFPSVEEAVLTEVRGEAIAVVHERAPAAGGSATFSKELAFTLRSTAGFTCRDGQPSEATCGADADCGAARACQNAAAEGCLRVCEGACAEGGLGCLQGERTRVCTGIEIGVDPTRALSVDLRGDPTRPTLVAAPAAALFSPLRGAWFVTYPGSRTMVEVRPIENGFQIGYAR